MLQPVDPRSSGYDRTNRDWICGRARLGKPCAAGPDASGRCGVRADGTDGAGNPPCRPRRSWRSRRGLVSLWVGLLVFGLVALGLGGNWVDDVASPGPVSPHHAAVADCADCHDAPLDGGALPLVSAALGLKGDKAPPDAGKCLVCHIAGDYPTAPHGYGPDILEAKVSDATSRAKVVHWPLEKGAEKEGGEHHLVCSTCHREHGGDANLVRKAAAQTCESCHAWGEIVFPGKHPPFQSYPAKRRTVIFYDHETHGKQYFPDNPTFARNNCRECHDLADDGRRMVNKSLTVMCLDCHGRGTEVPVMGPPGVVFLNPPGFDVDTLANKGMGVGQWPVFAEAPPSALTRMMLTGDPDTAAALNRLDGKPLMDLSDATPEALQDVQTLAWGMKGLLVSLRDQGPKSALAPRLERVLGRAPTEEEVKGLAGGLPQDVLTQAIMRWFPALDAEVAAHGKGEVVPTVPLMDGKPMATLKGATQPPPAGADEGGAILGEESAILGDEGGSLLGEESSIPGERGLGGDAGSILGDEGALLGEEAAILGGEGGGLMGGDEGLPSLEELMGEPESEADIAEDAAPQDNAGGMAAPDWANLGGWFENDFAILYRPAEVIDDTIHKWIDLSGAPGFTQGGGSPFQDLAAPGALSACGKCHGFTGTPETGLALDWVPRLPAQGSTVFRHAPHVTAPQAEGCLSCHVQGENSSALQASFKQNNPLDFRSNFTPMTVQQCATCHKPEESALGACATCHRYHPGGVAPAFPEGVNANLGQTD
ncbi:MAG: hypothetical protein K9H25_14920 [Rhodospirillum sp.]|nr:hypothetical protein [Rhodospirillum sp.]MCF8492066.1 hypothetical protein [Rhodospirillum sp.]